ncbi:LAETG motif-containing sortase-dependent surface protein [Streptomyces sp. ICC4]|uniref:LAETG motif-containing sortase-dependent surface protein n=1 Tax=Streptomyces sp. ICC4 TaxID=2099584 RepID=UPI0023B80CDA|nr:LAETG motif-containing sortase-dependent surface protein [Streptomyces sp. ICC4]
MGAVSTTYFRAHETGASSTSGTEANLAETGGGSLTPYVTGGALILLGFGAAALVVTRRGRAS